jgi:hypothetical protein
MKDGVLLAAFQVGVEILQMQQAFLAKELFSCYAERIAI